MVLAGAHKGRVGYVKVILLHVMIMMTMTVTMIITMIIMAMVIMVMMGITNMTWLSHDRNDLCIKHVYVCVCVTCALGSTRQ